MFRQGDLERQRGYPVSPLMDRSKLGITKSQPGFFNVMVIPLFKCVSYECPQDFQCYPMHQKIAFE